MRLCRPLSDLAICPSLMGLLTLYLCVTWINLCSKRSWLKIVAWCPIFLTSTYFTKRVHIKGRGCQTLWVCSMVCVGKNIANCPETPNFSLHARVVRAVPTRPHGADAVHARCNNTLSGTQ